MNLPTMLHTKTTTADIAEAQDWLNQIIKREIRQRFDRAVLSSVKTAWVIIAKQYDTELADEMESDLEFEKSK